MTEPNTSWAMPEPGSPEPAVPAPGTPAPSVAPVVAPGKKSSGLVNAVLVVGAIVAVGGVAFAVGRTSAPAQAAGFRGSAGGQGVTQGGTQALPGMPAGSFDPGQGGPGGVPGGGDRTMTISGTVKSIDGTTMVITTSSGSESTIDLAGASYHSQAAASASDVQVGTEVSVATEGFGFRRPDASADPGTAGGSGSITATDVTITGGE